MQADFEEIKVSDKEIFTKFIQQLADKLHQKNFILSVSVIPRPTDTLATEYDRWYFENRSGGYDYQALAKIADFISIQTYDQHNFFTTPGPMAAVDWTEKCTEHLLKFIPSQKISLGIPLYSGYWKTVGLSPKLTHLSYTASANMIKQNNIALIWNDEWKNYFAVFTKDYLNEYLFLEDENLSKASWNW